MSNSEKNRVFIINSPVDRLSVRETLELIEESIVNKRKIQHVCVNAGKIVNMQNDEFLRKAVVESDIISADGQSVVWASRFLGTPLPERVNGTNLMEDLIKMAYEKNYRCFFFGAKEDIVRKVKLHYSNKYSDKIIAGYRNGYYDPDQEQSIVDLINNSCADILFVAITSPKKEIFLNKFKKSLNVPFIMGVGGSFDVIAGVVKRAPDWMQKTGLEWFFRLLQEPNRMWKRYLIGNSKFIFYVIKQKIGFLK